MTQGSVREVSVLAEKQDVVFKGTKDGLLLTLSDSQDFEVLREKLKDHLKRAELFFQGSDVVLDTGKAAFSLDEILEIQNILAYPYGLKLKKIIHKDEPKARETRKTGAEAPRAAEPPRTTGFAGLPLSAVAPEGGSSRSSRSVSRQAYEDLVASLPETLLYKGTLRSGQRVDYEGNVVIVGDVNPGAEIKATGDIVILGALRGLAHAGSAGGEGAVVAFRLAPTQLRVGDVIGRPPEGGPLGREPEVARLKDGVIVIEPLEGTRWEGER